VREESEGARGLSKLANRPRVRIESDALREERDSMIDFHSVGSRVRREARKVMAKQMRKGGDSMDGFSGWARPYVDSIRFEWISLSVLICPVFAVVGWIIFLVLFQLNINERALQSTVRISLVEKAQRIMANFAADVAHVSAQEQTYLREYSRDKTEVAEKEVLDVLNLIVFGGEVKTDIGTVTIGRIQEGTTENTLLLKDACIPLVTLPLDELRLSVGNPNTTSDDISAMYDECKTMHNAILDEGAYGAVIEIVTIARRLRANLPNPDVESPLFTPYRIHRHQ